MVKQNALCRYNIILGGYYDVLTIMAPVSDRDGANTTDSAVSFYEGLNMDLLRHSRDDREIPNSNILIDIMIPL